MHWYNGYGMGYGGVMMALIGLLLLGGAVAITVLAMRRPHEDSGSAQRILEDRLARGEIDADEFRRVRDLLRTR
ncbi:putative membrane protein [Saccharothrix ecbatanensis]|uniref:Putative membrane protein n=1 Tax=Saccharothrix ecbatanensis TaxID=1105145 RepID=A0A7W9LYT2_9PSEU|nr:SHOCT domain-containing protein [Saccharothrix ecbatanensis]MBB5801190.1 putative membrane protein [Saccharothrix ecbatanensis]